MKTNEYNSTQKHWIEQGIKQSIESLEGLKEIYKKSNNDAKLFEIFFNQSKMLVGTCMRNIEETLTGKEIYNVNLKYLSQNISRITNSINNSINEFKIDNDVNKLESKVLNDTDYLYALANMIRDEGDE